ncbi:MAG: transporter [bacterium]|nr:transporter [bacterium]
MNSSPLSLAFLVLFAQSPSLASPASAQDPEVGGGDPTEPAPFWTWDGTRSDTVRPHGLAHARMVRDGEWHFGYRFDYASYDGLRDGRDDVSDRDLFAEGYDVAAQDLTIETHTFEVLYGMNERWTAFAQLPYMRKELDSQTDGGGSFDTETDGIGDLVVGAIHSLREGDKDELLVNLGLGIPTGSFDEKDRDETGTRRVAPYVMQLGTGTFDLYPGITWTVQEEHCTWGLAGQGRIHVDKNSDDWAVSDSLRASAWVARPWTDRLVGSLRIESLSWGDYHGSNEDLRPDDNPLEDDNRQGGARIDVYSGLAYDLRDSEEALNRLELEIGFPIDEWVDGPQLSAEFSLTFSWRILL